MATVRCLMTKEHSAKRAMARLQIIVAVEAADGTWSERWEARTLAHAQLIADDMVRQGARGASVWNVNPSGTLVRKPFYTVFQPVGDDA